MNYVNYAMQAISMQISRYARWPTSTPIGLFLGHNIISLAKSDQTKRILQHTVFGWAKAKQNKPFINQPTLSIDSPSYLVTI